jgi:chromosome segregation ATPase
METRSSARAGRNAYFMMFDTSMSRSEDDPIDSKQVMRERVERLEVESEKVNGELNVCRKELKGKCREIILLKKKLANLEKQTKDLECYRKLVKRKSHEIEEKNISIKDLLKEIEESRLEKESIVEGYKKNNQDLLMKLQEAERSNFVLRCNYDDIFERLEGPKTGKERTNTMNELETSETHCRG